MDNSPRAAFIKWFLLGGVVASLLLVSQAISVGGAAGLLQVGEANDLRPLIEAELGEIPLAQGRGHDGQMFYAIGLDLSGRDVGPFLDHPGYRIRRILYPAVASLFGRLGGEALLYSMIVFAGLCFAWAAGTTAWIGVRGGRSDWLALAVVLNPGVWLSVRLLTSDVVALALMLGGLAAWMGRSRLSVLAFALSGLTKDAYLLAPIGLATRKRWLVAAVPAAVLLGWAAWVSTQMEGGLSPSDNFSLPLMGLVESVSNWSTLEWRDLAYMGIALTAVAVGLVVSLRNRTTWLRGPIVFWSLLGAVSSSAVWDFGNNALRAFAPLIVLLALSRTEFHDLESETDAPLWRLPFDLVRFGGRRNGT